MVDLHETRQRPQHVDRGVNVVVVQSAVQVDIAFRDVAGQIRDGVRDIVIGHGEYWDLGDGPLVVKQNKSTKKTRPNVLCGHVRAHTPCGP